MIGKASATTTANGTYSLAVTASGKPSLSVTASGYYTRASAVAMTGGTTINPEIIPQGDGFDLAFFDDTFRVSGGGPNSNNEMVDATIGINGTVMSVDVNDPTNPFPGAIFRHEFAHAMGYSFPGTRGAYRPCQGRQSWVQTRW